MYGLTDKNLMQFTDVFRKHKQITRVTLFGSRAKNTYRAGSDIDLAVAGVNLQFSNLLTISSQLEELGTLYSFDVVAIDRLKNKALLEHINRVGVVIYQADSET